MRWYRLLNRKRSRWACGAPACGSRLKNWPLQHRARPKPLAFSAAAARPGWAGRRQRKRQEKKSEESRVVVNPALRWGKPSRGDQKIVNRLTYISVANRREFGKCRFNWPAAAAYNTARKKAIHVSVFSNLDGLGRALPGPRAVGIAAGDHAPGAQRRGPGLDGAGGLSAVYRLFALHADWRAAGRPATGKADRIDSQRLRQARRTLYRRWPDGGPLGQAPPGGPRHGPPGDQNGGYSHGNGQHSTVLLGLGGDSPRDCRGCR